MPVSTQVRGGREERRCHRCDMQTRNIFTPRYPMKWNHFFQGDPTCQENLLWVERPRDGYLASGSKNCQILSPLPNMTQKQKISDCWPFSWQYHLQIGRDTRQSLSLWHLSRSLVARRILTTGPLFLGLFNLQSYILSFFLTSGVALYQEAGSASGGSCFATGEWTVPSKPPSPPMRPPAGGKNIAAAEQFEFVGNLFSRTAMITVKQGDCTA